jgi:CubicO group peptidase (beta-lactamase class C family)
VFDRPRFPIGAFLATALLAACGGADVSPTPAAGGGEAVAATLAEAPAPRTFGMDSTLLSGAVEQARGLPRLRTLLVARHGEMELEEHFRGPALTSPANVKSVSKSVLSALVGIAVEEGHLGVDQPIAPLFEEYLAAAEDPRKRQITVAHLLSMQSGLERTSGTFYGRWVTSPNWVRYALTRPMVDEPGGARLYSTGNSHLLSAALTRATGRDTWSYAREKLAAPLGITLPRWPTDPQGIYFGGNEMRMTPHAMVRFGELYRNGGRYQGVQIVPETWVRESLAPRAGLRRPGEAYGFGWFLSSVAGYPMFYAWGYGGQFIFVIPDLELTVVTTSDPDTPREGEHIRAVRQVLEHWIVPAAMAGKYREAGALPRATVHDPAAAPEGTRTSGSARGGRG